MKYKFYEIDPFTGQVGTEPLTMLECLPENIARIADQLSECYRVWDSDGKLAAEKLPKRVVNGQQVPIHELFFGVLNPGQARSLFPGGQPSAEVSTLAAQLVRQATTLEPRKPGTWVPAERRMKPCIGNPVSLPAIGHMDHEFPALLVRVSFVGSI